MGDSDPGRAGDLGNGEVVQVSDDQQCSRCLELEARCADLEELIEDLKERIRKLEEVLDEIRHFCYQVISRSNKVLGKRSGVPRGEWALGHHTRRIVRYTRKDKSMDTMLYDSLPDIGLDSLLDDGYSVPGMLDQPSFDDLKRD